MKSVPKALARTVFWDVCSEKLGDQMVKLVERNSVLKAKHGEKMIEVKIRFWTNGLARGKDKILRKHALTAGVVRMEPNASHAIKPGRPKPFHTLLDVGSVIEKVLIEHGVVLHPGRRMSKYIKAR